MSQNLVVYFSASGITKGVAEQLASKVSADLVEIIPKKKYSKSDLNWLNPLSRSSKEMCNKSIRPEIANDKLDTSKYDVIYLGFPIWWYVAPTIVNTFLEANDFSGKKIILFATSGSSGFGNTMEELKPSASSANFVEGKILKTRKKEEDIVQFVKEFN